MREQHRIHSERARRRRQIRALRVQHKELFQRIHQNHYQEQVELRKKLYELQRDMDALQGNGRHRNPFEADTNFKQYYRRLRYGRVVFLFLNITLWTLLFVLSGPATGLRVVLLVMALLTTVSNVFELLFLLGVKNRILTPVQNLNDGVAEIMKGNYTVVVDPYTHSEVSELIDSFNDMAHKLYEDEQLKGEYEQNRKMLIANISHDLKTPITTIQGYVEAIRDGVSPEKLEPALAIIHNNAQYMNRLIDDLFLFSKLDMDKLDFNFAPVNIRAYMADLMEEFRLELSERDVALAYTDGLKADRVLRIDPKRMHQVIRNIIDNAGKHGSTDGLRIAARLYEADGRVCIDLANNGPTIPAEHLARIFERFYRADAARTKDTASTGLGLAIAHELVAAHGGQITVQSSDGAGTCFTIALPTLTQEGETP